MTRGHVVKFAVPYLSYNINVKYDSNDNYRVLVDKNKPLIETINSTKLSIV